MHKLKNNKPRNQEPSLIKRRQGGQKHIDPQESVSTKIDTPWMTPVHAQGLQGKNDAQDKKSQSGEGQKSMSKYYTHLEIIDSKLGQLAQSWNFHIFPAK